jgi:hypothetical protein
MCTSSNAFEKRAVDPNMLKSERKDGTCPK